MRQMREIASGAGRPRNDGRGISGRASRGAGDARCGTPLPRCKERLLPLRPSFPLCLTSSANTDQGHSPFEIESFEKVACQPDSKNRLADVGRCFGEKLKFSCRLGLHLVGVALAGLPLMPPTDAHGKSEHNAHCHQCTDEGEYLGVRQFAHHFSSSGMVRKPMNIITHDKIKPKSTAHSSRRPEINFPTTTIVSMYFETSRNILPSSNRRVRSCSIKIY